MLSSGLPGLVLLQFEDIVPRCMVERLGGQPQKHPPKKKPHKCGVTSLKKSVFLICLQAEEGRQLVPAVSTVSSRTLPWRCCWG